MPKFVSLLISSFSIWKKATRKPLALLGLLSFLSFGLLPGCAPPASSPIITLDRTQPAKEIVACAQLYGGISDSVYNAGLELTKQNLLHIVHPDQGNITFYSVKMSNETTDTRDILVAGQIAAVKPTPHLPGLPPFLDPATKKQIMTQYAQLQHDAQSSLAQAQAQAQQLAGEIMQHDAKHEPADDHEGVDVTGCLVQASRLFSQQRNVERHILLISDIEEGSNASQGVSLHLPGVLVTVDFLYDDPAKDVADRQQAFRQRCMQAGAASVEFVDSTQAGLLTDMFGK